VRTESTSLSLAACDLDRTLIYSAAALRLPMAGADAPRLLCVEHYGGAPLSYLTESAGSLLVALAGRAVLVPTTTRSREQYARIRLPGPPAKYAICANGGHLLVDSVPDVAWHTAVQARLVASSAPLEEVHSYLHRLADPAWVRTVRIAEELFIYLVVNRTALPVSVVDEVSQWAAGRGWAVSLQGRKLYLVPEELTKAAAVAEVARRIGAATVLAAGDSLLDAELLEYADAGIRPAHGELADAGWTRPHVAVTGAAGVLAGEEILTWLIARSPADALAVRGPSTRSAQDPVR
jgi:hypothetical protein